MLPSNKKGISLFSRMLIAFLMVVILISGALTWAFYVFSSTSIEKRTAENVVQQFKDIEYHFVFESREDMIKDLRILASNPVLDGFIMSSPMEKEIGARAVERLFLGSMKYHESYEGLTFVDAFGMEQVRVDRSGRVKKYRNMSANQLFTRIKAGAPGGVDLVGPWKDSAGRVVASIGIHKVDQDIGKFGGALIIDWNLNSFIEYLGGIKIFNENLFWLFSRDGELLMQPVSTGEAFDPRPYLSKDVQSDPRLLLVKEGMVVYQDLSVLPGKSMVRLAIGIPLSMLLKDVQAMLKYILLVSLLALLIAAIIALYLSRHLSRPITVLAHAVSHLAKGDLTTRVRVKSTGEVRMLIDSFNRMAADLEKTTVSRNYMDEIISSMSDALIVLAPDRTITRVNTAASYLLEYNESELVGRPMDMVLLDEEGVENDTLALLLEQNVKSINSVERTYRTKHWKKIPVLFSASVMRGINGEIEGVVCVARDITELKKAEEKLKQSAQETREMYDELKTFTYITSHDLRAPLVNIKGFTKELLGGIGEIRRAFAKSPENVEEEQRKKLSGVIEKEIPEALKFIDLSASRMDMLINAILKLSRTDNRKIVHELIHTEDMVRGILNTMAQQIGSRGISVTIERLPDLVSDRIVVEQIFGNLLDNAVKYLDPGRQGEIALTVELDDEKAIFHVRDNGRGMAAEDIPRAFESFRRIGKQDVPGEGMGLAYVKTSIRKLGGRIWCESEPGRGTTFSFSLPFRRDADAGKQSHEEEYNNKEKT